MKRVVSVSLGSSKRDHSVNAEFAGIPFEIKRIGTDGNIEKAKKIVAQLDGKVDAIGLGGIDLYLFAGQQRYVVRDARKIAEQAKFTPVVDGSGLKNTLESKVVEYLRKNHNLDFLGQPVLMVCGVDRPGMARALVEAGAQVTFGDLIFGLGLPLPLRSIDSLERAARLVVPIVSKLPFKILYPTGTKQNNTVSRWSELYHQADIIAGDFHYIKRYMPDTLTNKIVITNTVTQEDVMELRNRRVRILVTTTPELSGRSFGTNVMEGILLALAKKKQADLSPADYGDLLERIGFMPRVTYLE